MSVTELTAKVRELKELQQLITAAEQEAEEIKDLIKKEMTSRAVDELEVDVFKVSWKAVSTARFDGTAFKATHKDLYSQYTKATEIRRFTVA